MVYIFYLLDELSGLLDRFLQERDSLLSLRDSVCLCLVQLVLKLLQVAELLYLVVLACLNGLVEILYDIVVVLVLHLNGTNIGLQPLLFCDSSIDLLLSFLVDHRLVCILAQHLAVVFSDCGGLCLLLLQGFRVLILNLFLFIYLGLYLARSVFFSPGLLGGLLGLLCVLVE